MKCDKQITDLMHEYLDGHITKKDEQTLRSHLQTCPACQEHFHELKRAISLVKANSDLRPSSSFTSQVMNNLPKERKRIGVQRWLRMHPLLTAAAIFFVMMFGGVYSAWDQDHQLSYPKGKNLVVEDDTVIVPEGVRVDGDLVVKNGNLKIDGEVEGNVVIINGDHLMASTGNISGEIKQVNEIFEWLWYHIKDISRSIFDMTSK
ncbi:anti-sigma factor family protein [Saliterribacillus persicus]|nr:anti-sigma factor [Saliterribacillus persicus]